MRRRTRVARYAPEHGFIAAAEGRSEHPG